MFADIDLSDNGVFEYYGLQITKGNCEKAIDELTNNEYKEFYLYLANNKSLNEFLASGKEAIFKNFKQDSIFKLPEFVKFISPYFAPKFDKALLTAFDNDNADLTKAILNTSFLITQTDLNSAFKSVSNNIQNKIAEIDVITKDIKNEESSYDEDDIEEVVHLVKDYFPTNTLNCLPQYFQSQILKIAKSINYLSNSIWDAFDITQIPNDLTEYLLTLDIHGLDRPTFENNYKIIKKKNDERIEQVRNAPLLKEWADILINLKRTASKIENKELTPKSVFKTIDSISLVDLNNLPSFANEIRYSIAYVLREISISMWNTHHDIDSAIEVITRALSINLPTNDFSKLNSDLAKLNEIKKDKNEIGEPIDSPPDLYPSPIIGNAIYGKTLYFTFFTIPILPIARYNCKPTVNGYRFYGKLKLHSWQKIWKWSLLGGVLLWLTIAFADSNKKSYDYSPSQSDNIIKPSTPIDYTNKNDNTNTSTNDNTTSTPPKYENLEPIESEYKGNQLMDGSSPLNGCFGKGIYSGNATLTIENGGNSDAIVCLFSVDNNTTIRNVYVQKNSNYTITNISQGDYKIRVFYGNDWNPDLENSCGTKGSFESDIHYSEFNQTTYFEDDDSGYTNATITLYKVVGGNARSSSIDESSFFNK